MTGENEEDILKNTDIQKIESAAFFIRTLSSRAAYIEKEEESYYTIVHRS
jgi:hypothetical protein